MSNKEFRYGDDRTIHRTNEVNVERDAKTGKVVSVWFRCMLLPFTDTEVDVHRAQEMSCAYADGRGIPRLKAIVIHDKDHNKVDQDTEPHGEHKEHYSTDSEVGDFLNKD